jgi:hypothetical protein
MSLRVTVDPEFVAQIGMDLSRLVGKSFYVLCPLDGEGTTPLYSGEELEERRGATAASLDSLLAIFPELIPYGVFTDEQIAGWYDTLNFFGLLLSDPPLHVRVLPKRRR